MNKRLITWGEDSPRVIEFNTLLAMAKTYSSICHQYYVERTSTHRVRITYSNPDEYGVDHPITMFVPCFNRGPCWVVLVPTKFENVTSDIYDPYQLFEGFFLSETMNPNEVLTDQEIERGYI